MELKHILKLVYDMGKSEGIEIGREQVLNENLIRLEKQLERNYEDGYILSDEG